MPFEVAGLVVSLAGGSIPGLALDPRTASTGSSEVGIHVGHLHHETPACIAGPRRIESVLVRGPVEPDHHVSDANFTANNVAVGVSVDTARVESERLNEETVSGLDVAIHQHWDDRLD